MFRKHFALPLLMVCCGLFSTSTSATNPCNAAAYQAFDFWLGDWQVTNNNTGTLAGVNRIQKSLNGCVIEEHYTTAQGYEGKSLNMYDRQTQSWHQTWMDNSGLVLKLQGNLTAAGDMQMSGTGLAADGREILHRITWRELAKNDVTQVWQVSKDNGENWQTVFDGRYSPREQ